MTKLQNKCIGYVSPSEIIGKYMYYMETTHGFPHEDFQSLLDNPETRLKTSLSAYIWFTKNYGIPREDEKLNEQDFIKKNMKFLKIMAKKINSGNKCYCLGGKD